MRKILSLLLLVPFTIIVAQTTVVSQQPTSRYYNSWRFGLNIGGMWQVADVRSTAGVAGGFTLEKGIFENKTNFFSLAIRGRGLFGNTYGLDNSRNYNIKNNPALNGDYNEDIKYGSDSTMPYVYNNYRTQINEGALELQISFNRLRERTNILLNLWGGIGITSYRANTNLLDVNGKMYNYSKVDSVGSKSAVLSSHKNLLDKSYESYANGSKKNNIYTFSPSAGIGIGYKVSDGFSILFEHKVTFPQGTYADYLDGIVGANKDMIAGSNDYYHYTGLNLLFRLGKGKSKAKSTTTNTVANTYQPVPTNTVVNVPTNTLSVNPSNTIPVEKKPIVNFVNPSVSPYVEKRNDIYNVLANVYNVTNRSQVNVTVNGIGINNFSFAGKNVDFPANLNLGNNVVVVSASNSAGSDSKTTIINYAGDPPQIIYTSPSPNPFNTTVPEADVTANILYVTNNYDVVIKYNNVVLNNYSYSTVNGQFSTKLPLLKGMNVLEISAKNKFGTDNKKMVINFTAPMATTTNTATSSRPVKVTITDPAPLYYKVSSPSYNVKATVSGVTSASQVTVTLNGVVTAFTYVGGTVDVPANNLLQGNNTFVVSASNATSFDAKSAIIEYEIIRKSPPPTVVITSPQPSPYTTTQNTYLFKATTNFISDISQTEVKFNGVIVNNHTYTSGFVEYNAALSPNSNNIFEIKVTNGNGSNSASAIVKHEAITNTEIGLKTKVICHRSGKMAYETITILESEWVMHQAHGDYEGACKETPSNPGGEIDPQITICHNNNGVKQTISIKQSQWATHQAHGDEQGECPKINDPGTSANLDPDMVICHNFTGVPETITIKQSEWPLHQAHGDKQGPCPRPVNPKVVLETDPDIMICHNDGNGGKQTMTIKQSQWSTHQAHGDIQGACPRIGNPSLNVDPDPDIVICHNFTGVPETMTIKQSAWAAHQAHGDTKGACPTNTTGAGTAPETGLGKKITICHIPPGNNSNPQTIEINESAWPAHQAHGDTKGACVVVTTPTVPSNPGTGNSGSTKKIKICHIPPGNNSNPQTIEISENAWPAHEAHGDTKGECPPQKTIKQTEGEVKGLQPSEGGSFNQNIVPVKKDSVQKGEIIKGGRPR